MRHADLAAAEKASKEADFAREWWVTRAWKQPLSLAEREKMFPSRREDQYDPWPPSRGDEHRAPDMDAQQRLREGQLVQVVQRVGPMHWLNGSIGELVSYDYNLVRWKVKFPNAILEVPAQCLSQERSKGGWSLEAQLAEQRHRAPMASLPRGQQQLRPRSCSDHGG